MTLSASDYDFRFESGRLCLDCAATLASRHGDAFERWRNASDLHRWLKEAGLVSPPRRLDDADLAAARTLREAVYRTVTARKRGTAPHEDDIALINAHATHAPPAPQLDAAGEHGSLVAAAPFEAALSAIARDAIDLITGPWLDRLRECGEDTCSILFVDMSRPGKRRWCSMNRCGNKIKKAAFRERHAAP